MSYDLERERQKEQDIRKAFRECFPLAYEGDLPWAACHIRGFLKDRIEIEVREGVQHFVSRVTRVLCEISPPKTHIEDMARIVVEEAKRYRTAKPQLELAAEAIKERDELREVVRAIGRAVGCNHTEDPDGRAKLVQCVEDQLKAKANA